jgi:hypothetical protein
VNGASPMGKLIIGNNLEAGRLLRGDCPALYLVPI